MIPTHTYGNGGQKKSQSSYSLERRESDLSDQSGQVDSEASSVSNVTGFEEELKALRHYLPNNGSSDCIGAMLSPFNKDMEHRLLQVTKELLEAKSQLASTKYLLAENERRIASDNRQKLVNYERQVHQLTSDNTVLRKKLCKIEADSKESSELILKKYQMESDLVLMRNERKTMTEKINLLQQEINRRDVELIRARTETQDVIMQLKSKTSANETLKQRIIEQYSGLQETYLINGQLRIQMAKLKEELKTNQNTIEWYRSELDTCHKSISDLQKEQIRLNQSLYSEKLKTDKLKNNCKQLILQSEEIERTARLEKEDFLRKLQTFSQNNTNNGQCSLYNKVVIENLKNELERLKEAFTKQSVAKKNLESDNLELIKKVTILETTIDHKSVLINASNESKESVKREKYILENKLVSLSEQYEKLEEKFKQQMIKMDQDDLDKQRIQETIGKIKMDFKSLLTRLKLTQSEIEYNQCTISKLESEKCDLQMENEKLNTTILNNQQILIKTNEIMEMNDSLNESINELNTKCSADALLIKSLQTEISELKLNKNSEIDDLRSLNTSLQDEVNRCKQLIETYEADKRIIDENIKQLKESTLSDRNKYKLIEKEKDELRLKYLALNSELNGHQSDSARSDSECSEFSSLDSTRIEKSFSADVFSNEKSVQVAMDSFEFRHQKALTQVIQNEHNERLRRYDVSIRTLMRKIKHHMRSQKIAEQRADAAEKYALKMVLLKSSYESSVSMLESKERAIIDAEKQINDLTDQRNKILDKFRNALPDLLITDLDNLDELVLPLIQQLETDKTELFACNRELSNDITTFKSELEANNELKASLARVTLLNEELEKTVQDKCQQIVQLKESIEQLQIEENKLWIKINNLGTENEDRNIVIENLTRELSKANDTINDLKHSESNISVKYQMLSTELETAKDQNFTMRQQIENFAELRKEHVHNREKLLNEIADLKDELTEIKSEKISLENLCSNLKNAVSTLTKQNEERSYFSLPLRRLDFSHVERILKQSKEKQTTLDPLEECVESLKKEMTMLDSAIRRNNNSREEMSLMEELNLAERNRSNSLTQS